MKLRVGAAEELPPGTAVAVRAGELEVAVFNVDGELFAVDNACAHSGGPLVDGLVRDGAVTCPLHWWRYDLATGERKGTPHVRQATYAAAVVDGFVVVDVPEPEPELGIRDRLLRHAAEWTAQRGSGS